MTAVNCYDSSVENGGAPRHMCSVAVNRSWLIKVLHTCKVTQLILVRQKSVRLNRTEGTASGVVAS